LYYLASNTYFHTTREQEEELKEDREDLSRGELSTEKEKRAYSTAAELIREEKNREEERKEQKTT
jgi:hypothetical protein